MNPTSYCEVIPVSPKIKALPSGALSRIQNFANFSAFSSALSTEFDRRKLTILTARLRLQRLCRDRSTATDSLGDI